MKKLIQFVKDCVGELKKVVWPTRDSVIASTKVVIFSTVLVAAFLFAIESLWVKLLDLVL
ncbi:MAG: preprotein translocase subunit SecE [Spirochaetes bacterium GWD1_61_31]|nr:MAG: preprotein translocase subunit SecE [Spirochaetes bacterium GWB1_60_80]OHD31292.1 MAG: preprotein translocase subunit SecE [Spirochaetes bacterium GWC1_61_12]OHD39478.1 MAG: preprotein translocase subunit SecE [Spirochaetes bacterium GWD1_61_31]OHD45530.1 MAG: preprotein translocase subunit SecE [Spirochaetes bacterium GWE1_60_18]OHD58103.1 MAG: preprotein translocase subunit SecE [Spirochaetes bacterium GWF1_60_12]HAP44674.1 preprotein translocase subunit SecE [Spirochaetaceae bacteri